MEEKAKQGAVLALGLGAAIAVPLLLKRKKPKEKEQGIIQIETYDCYGNLVPTSSPLELTEGSPPGPYTTTITVTNTTTRGGLSWEADFGGSVEGLVDGDKWLFAQDISGLWGARESKTFSYTYEVPIGWGGARGAIVAVITAPMGPQIAAASEPVYILAVETVYGATVVIR